MSCARHDGNVVNLGNELSILEPRHHSRISAHANAVVQLPPAASVICRKSHTRRLMERLVSLYLQRRVPLWRRWTATQTLLTSLRRCSLAASSPPMVCTPAWQTSFQTLHNRCAPARHLHVLRILQCFPAARGTVVQLCDALWPRTWLGCIVFSSAVRATAAACACSPATGLVPRCQLRVRMLQTRSRGCARRCGWQWPRPASGATSGPP